MGYEPLMSQRRKCEICYYWQPWSHSGTIKCCHYLLLTGKRRGPDPCEKWTPKTIPMRRRKYRGPNIVLDSQIEGKKKK